MRVIADLLGKIKNNVYPLKSPKRKAALEEVALYCQYKPTPFLRHFGFVQAIGSSIVTLDKESQELCLFILTRFSKDHVLKKEIIDDGLYPTIKKLLTIGDVKSRIMALEALVPLHDYDEIKDKLTKKVYNYYLGYCDVHTVDE